MPNPDFSENFNDRKQGNVTKKKPRENNKTAMPEKKVMSEAGKDGME